MVRPAVWILEDDQDVGFVMHEMLAKQYTTRILPTLASLKKELAEARNHADTLIYSTEKTVKDLGDKVESGLKTEIDTAIERLKKAMETTDTGEIKRLSDELTQNSHKLAEKMYSQASQQGPGGDAGPEHGAGGPSGGKKADEDVVDADFEEVK